MEQRIRFVSARDGARLAYATHGRGYPLVRAAHWLTHLQYDWESPIWRPWLTDLGARFEVLRYDERGCGLSDWDVDEFSMDAWVDDLETVIDAAGFERFALLGMSQGSQLAISYAANHPERVSHLIILGGHLTGWGRRELTTDERDEIEAMITLMRVAWGRDNPAFRRLVTTDFVPDGDESLLRAYDELMRRTTSPDNAARFERAFGEIDVADLAPRVRVPTLVMHVDDDHVVPSFWGPRIAAAIPGAQFAPLPGRNHVIRPDEPAWPRFLALLDEFVGTGVRTPTRAALAHPRGPDAALSERERDVLRLVAEGWSNAQIAAELVLSVRTVERHLSNVYLKLGVSGKAARAAAAVELVRAANRASG